jgi:molybdenum cofactor cytidylyltransferase
MTKIPVLLLAAGGSSRMGQPKQLLAWGNESLIEHQIKTLIETGNPVNVILGFNSNLIIPLIEKYKANIYINPDWESGMGSSISFGIQQIMHKYTHAKGVLICLLDQPLVTASFLKRMIDAWQPGDQQIVASRSVSGWTGVPVLFDKYYFHDLLEVENDQGAKKIIQQYEKNVILVDAGELIEDMDTFDSYQQLLHKLDLR